MRAAPRRSLSVLVVIGLTLLWAALAFAAGASPARAGAGNVVEISGFAYSPAELTITVGDTVTWTNLDAVEHTATATDGSWDTGLLGEGESGSITFTAPGTFDYLCTPHPSMTGRIVVVAAAGPSATPAPSSSSGGALPDVAMSTAGGSSTIMILLGTILVGVALLLVALQAVVRGFGEPGQD
jgi:plastocyanin